MPRPIRFLAGPGLSRLGFLGLGFLLLAVSTALVPGNLSPRAAAQGVTTPTVVQLPTFSFFSVSTTVSVPDSGEGFLGGRRRSGRSRLRFGPRGPLGPSAIGGGFVASDARAHAIVHDMAELDADVLSKARQAPPLTPLEIVPPRVVAASTAERPTGSVAQARALHDAELATAEDEIALLFAKAVETEERGNVLAARARYRQVAHRATGALRRKALAKVRDLGDAAKSKKSTARAQPKP